MVTENWGSLTGHVGISNVWEGSFSYDMGQVSRLSLDPRPIGEIFDWQSQFSPIHSYFLRILTCVTSTPISISGHSHSHTSLEKLKKIVIYGYTLYEQCLTNWRYAVPVHSPRLSSTVVVYSRCFHINLRLRYVTRSLNLSEIQARLKPFC